MLHPLLEDRVVWQRIRRVQIMQHVLAPRGIAHDDDFPLRGVRRLVLDIPRALRQLLRVLVQAPHALAAVRGRQHQPEDGPVGRLEGFGELANVGDSVQSVTEPADEEEAVRLGVYGWGHFVLLIVCPVRRESICAGEGGSAGYCVLCAYRCRKED